MKEKFIGYSKAGGFTVSEKKPMRVRPSIHAMVTDLVIEANTGISLKAVICNPDWKDELSIAVTKMALAGRFDFEQSALKRIEELAKVIGQGKRDYLDSEAPEIFRVEFEGEGSKADVEAASKIFYHQLLENLLGLYFFSLGYKSETKEEAVARMVFNKVIESEGALETIKKAAKTPAEHFLLEGGRVMYAEANGGSGLNLVEVVMTVFDSSWQDLKDFSSQANNLH